MPDTSTETVAADELTPREQSAARAEALAASVVDEPERLEHLDEPGGAVIDASAHVLADDETAHPLERLLGKPWAIVPEALIEIGARLMRAEKAGGPVELQAARAERQANRSAADGSEIAVIPLHGTITPRGSFFSILFGGGGGLLAFRESFRQAMADSTISAIIIDVDSPGGLVDLVPETAAEIRAARGGKPIVAISNTLAASAAYWIASQADEVVITPSGQAGSIGVYTIHEDYSRLDELMGVKTTIISAGDRKTDGNPYEPLSRQARASLQERVDDIYDMFTGAVAAGRGVKVEAVKAGYGRGASVLAEEALRVGLADRIETLEQLATRLGGQANVESEPTLDDLDDEGDDELASAASAADDETPPVRADEDGGDDSHPPADYLTSPALREQPAWRL
jgi:signal peptide peptidase SppA